MHKKYAPCREGHMDMLQPYVNFNSLNVLVCPSLLYIHYWKSHLRDQNLCLQDPERICEIIHHRIRQYITRDVAIGMLRTAVVRRASLMFVVKSLDSCH